MRHYHSSIRHSRRIPFEQLESRHMLAFLAGDYNLSGAVDIGDHNEWRANFGRTDLSTEASGRW
jgi:hypothetical protein